MTILVFVYIYGDAMHIYELRPFVIQEVVVPGRIIQERAGHVAVITLDNVEKHNAIDVPMWISLKSVFDELRSDPSVRCVTIQGAGAAAFSAGADISEFETHRFTTEQVVHFHEHYVGACLTAIAEADIPVIAKIRGACMGGGLEISSVCDIRLADDTARFGAPVGRLGFPLAFAETQALFKIVGPSVAAELLLEGRILNAREAYERRLVTRIASAATLDQEAQICAENICKSSPSAARSHKQQLRRLMADPSPVSLVERMEGYSFAETEEYRQGIRKFLSRKKG